LLPGEVDQGPPLRARFVTIGSGLRVAQDQAANSVRVPSPECKGDVTTHRKAGDNGALQVQNIQQANEIVGVLVD
jgi:hypothetical protein